MKEEIPVEHHSDAANAKHFTSNTKPGTSDGNPQGNGAVIAEDRKPDVGVSCSRLLVQKPFVER